MDNSEYRDALSFIVGLTLGALVGTSAALLLAPQSGRRTRRQLARRAEELTETASEALEEARDEADRRSDRERDEATRGPRPRPGGQDQRPADGSRREGAGAAASLNRRPASGQKSKSSVTGAARVSVASPCNGSTVPHGPCDWQFVLGSVPRM